MEHDRKTKGYRGFYKKLLSLYPQRYRERFGESMWQTFNDLCDEKENARGYALLDFVLWMTVETSVAIIKERITNNKIDNMNNTNIWFKKLGWVYRPVSVVGWILTFLLATLIVWVFIVTDRNSHSASDTLIGTFPWAVIFTAILGWVASHTSESGVSKAK